MFKALKEVFHKTHEDDQLTAETSRVSQENTEAAQRLKKVMSDVFDYHGCPLRIVERPKL